MTAPLCLLRSKAEFERLRFGATARLDDALARADGANRAADTALARVDVAEAQLARLDAELAQKQARPCHICAGTGRAPATSAPGLGLPRPHLL